MKNTLLLFFFLISIFSYSQTGAKETQRHAASDSIGFPSLNRDWSAIEFQQVYNLIFQHDSLLKDISGDNKKELFSKLTTYKSYWFLESKYHTLDERVTFNLLIQPLVKTLLARYYQKGRDRDGKLFYEGEVAAFFDLLFKVTKNQVELMEEFVQAKPNLTKAQSDGLKKMIYGITTMIAGLVITIEKEYPYFSSESVCKLAGSLKEFYSFMHTRIEEDSRTEFDKRIETIVKTHSITCVRKTLQSK